VASGWTGLDGRDAVQVAVQQRVAGADNADEADDEAFVFCAGDDSRAEADGEDSDGHWWWQSTERHEQQSGWCHSAWEVLAAGSGLERGFEERRRRRA
jgi:hypothetical protein